MIDELETRKKSLQSLTDAMGADAMKSVPAYTIRINPDGTVEGEKAEGSPEEEAEETPPIEAAEDDAGASPIQQIINKKKRGF